MFSVTRNAASVVVIVTEGVVSVSATVDPADTKRHNSAKLSSVQAEEGVAVSSRGIVSPVRKLQEVPSLDWNDNRIVFEEASVAVVIDRFNRRNPVQIRLTDASVA